MRTKVMGIVNVTPDSFSDGGQFFKPEEAIRRVRNLIADGADIIDLGGESTRPGSVPIGWEEEWSRLEPVLRGLSPAETGTVPISVDTYHPETARMAVATGATIVNCVKEEAIPEMMAILRKNPKIELVIPFREGVCPPMDEGVCPHMDVRREAEDLAKDWDFDRLYLDPMIGFGTTREEDLALLRSIPELAKRGRVLVGASRKRIVKKLAGDLDSPRLRRAGNQVGKNVGGNVAIAVWCAMQGASVVRVHDVKETVQALQVVAALSA